MQKNSGEWHGAFKQTFVSTLARHFPQLRDFGQGPSRRGDGKSDGGFQMCQMAHVKESWVG